MEEVTRLAMEYEGAPRLIIDGYQIGDERDLVMIENVDGSYTQRPTGPECTLDDVNTGLKASHFKVGGKIIAAWGTRFWWPARVKTINQSKNTLTIEWDLDHTTTRGYDCRFCRPVSE